MFIDPYLLKAYNSHNQYGFHHLWMESEGSKEERREVGRKEI